jgi:hypothetical protein
MVGCVFEWVVESALGGLPSVLEMMMMRRKMNPTARTMRRDLERMNHRHGDGDEEVDVCGFGSVVGEELLSSFSVSVVESGNRSPDDAGEDEALRWSQSVDSHRHLWAVF